MCFFCRACAFLESNSIARQSCWNKKYTHSTRLEKSGKHQSWKCKSSADFYWESRWQNRTIQYSIGNCSRYLAEIFQTDSCSISNVVLLWLQLYHCAFCYRYYLHNRAASLLQSVFAFCFSNEEGQRDGFRNFVFHFLYFVLHKHCNARSRNDGWPFSFIPSLGFAFVVAALLLKIFKTDFSGAQKFFSWTSISSGLRYSIITLLLFYSVIVVSRNADWKDHLTLFRHDISAVENSAQAQNLLGLYAFMQSKDADQLQRKQLLEEAAVHFKKALGFIKITWILLMI